MTNHPYDDLQAFALGDLDEAAGDAVLRHADSCPTCAAVLADSMRGVAALAGVEGTREAAARVRPSSNARERWLLAASVAAVVLLGGWNVELRSAAAIVPVDALVHSHFTHHPLTGAQGEAKLIQALDGSWVYLVADGLRPLGGYELEVDGKAQGAIRADIAGRATAYFTRPPDKITSAALLGPAGIALRWTGD